MTRIIGSGVEKYSYEAIVVSALGSVVASIPVGQMAIVIPGAGDIASATTSALNGLNLAGNVPLS